MEEVADCPLDWGLEKVATGPSLDSYLERLDSSSRIWIRSPCDSIDKCCRYRATGHGEARNVEAEELG
jgi:hypothetical protein